MALAVLVYWGILSWHLILTKSPIVPGDAEVALPSNVRSSQFPTLSGALMATNGGSGLVGKPTTTHREEEDRNAPTCIGTGMTTE